jgi:phosphoglycolate phosphatase
VLAIFDWDGTLMDSTGKIINCMHCAAEDVALPQLSDAAVANIIGLGLPEAIAHLYPDASPAQAEALRLRYSEHFVHLDKTPMQLYPGVLDGLARLKAGGLTLAVATGKSRKGLDRILHDWDMHSLFDITRCADETASKPNPLMLTEILAITGFSPAEAVMVGDTEYDLAMAHSLQMPRLAVTYGAHAVERLLAFQPMLCSNDFDQVSRRILAHFSVTE